MSDPTSGTEKAVLAPGQLEALRNLERKQAGEAVDWINIAQARALTELGLAERNREGWNITAEGRAALASHDAAAAKTGTIRIVD